MMRADGDRVVMKFPSPKQMIWHYMISSGVSAKKTGYWVVLGPNERLKKITIDANTGLVKDFVQSPENQPQTHKSQRQIAHQLNILFNVILYWSLHLQLLITYIKHFIQDRLQYRNKIAAYVPCSLITIVLRAVDNEC